MCRPAYSISLQFRSFLRLAGLPHGFVSQLRKDGPGALIWRLKSATRGIQSRGISYLGFSYCLSENITPCIFNMNTNNDWRGESNSLSIYNLENRTLVKKEFYGVSFPTWGSLVAHLGSTLNLRPQKNERWNLKMTWKRPNPCWKTIHYFCVP